MALKGFKLLVVFVMILFDGEDFFQELDYWLVDWVGFVLWDWGDLTAFGDEFGAVGCGGEMLLGGAG